MQIQYYHEGHSGERAFQVKYRIATITDGTLTISNDNFIDLLFTSFVGSSTSSINDVVYNYNELLK